MAANVIEDFINAIKPRPAGTKNRAYSATVSRIDEQGVVWVNIAGSEKETPTALVSAEVKRGDSVNVEWRNNKLYLASNVSDPAAGVMRVSDVEKDTNEARKAAAEAWQYADSAHQAADEAQAQATLATGYANDALTQLSTVESVVDTLSWITEHGSMTLTTDTAIDPTHIYFVVDPNGDYVVGTTHYSIVTEPKVSELSTYYVLSIDEAVSNYVASHLALTNDGLYVVKDNEGYKVLLSNTGLQIQDDSGAVAASFGSAVIVGKNQAGYTRFELSDTGFKFLDRTRNGGSDTILLNVSTKDILGNELISYTLGSQVGTSATRGTYSVAEALGNAEGDYSHAEGYSTHASGDSSHAEGRGGTTASGTASHAEGFETLASGWASHAQNNRTIAQREAQTALGEYNVADAGGASPLVRGDYAVIVGNGTADNARSNAVAVAWDGSVRVNSDAYVGCNPDSSGGSKVATTDLPYYDIKDLILTASSGVTINSAYLYVFGERVAQLYLDVTFSSNQTANTSYDIGTLPSTIRPRNLAMLGSTYGAGQITSAGVMSFRPQMNLNSGAHRYFTSTYLLLTPYTG